MIPEPTVTKESYTIQGESEDVQIQNAGNDHELWNQTDQRSNSDSFTHFPVTLDKLLNSHIP